MKEPDIHSQHSQAQKGVLVIGISSRALFDLGESHAVFEASGLQAYSNYQNTLFGPGML